ncbi:putative histidine kinase [Methanocella paludicola SANAE]|uniref:histidine kinase n=1 Tax=Methanocella paludicola (strain DSM 17711 / JCM 13418 / NBRC 101707 / SANAE) TaxID=304371 RepID=D1YY92_METPS|nr:PAS domain S-box protein [Methanocella paludicola]BAI61414.1 putative histidine kinase [Methanocella paludicola SANAE]
MTVHSHNKTADGRDAALAEKLRKSEERFFQLIEHLPLPTVVSDSEDNIEYMNSKVTRFFGYSLRDAPSIEDWWPLAYPDPAYRSMVMAQWNSLISRSESDEIGLMESNVTCKDGTVKVVEFFGTYIGDKMLVMMRDVTERKRSEEKLQAREARLNSIFRAAPVGIGLVADRVIQDVNDRLCDMTGYSRDELIGKSARIFYPSDEEFDFVGQEKYRQIGERGTGSVETRWQRKDGSIIHIILSSTPLDPKDWKAGVTFTALDITLRKKYEEDLRKSKAQAELYVDLMGHDINNMNQISLGFLELAHGIMKLEGKLDLSNIELIEKPIESLKNSSKLIDNVRKLQKEKEGLYNPAIVDLDSLLEEVKSYYISVPGRDVTINFVPAGGHKVMANELLKDVFINIVGNAIKHSSGALDISITIKETVIGDKKYYKVMVEDNGPGIPDGLKQTLFDRLNLTSTRARGKGFGLCLIKMLIDDYSGKFWVEDRVEGDYRKGARFVVMLPALDS